MVDGALLKASKIEKAWRSGQIQRRRSCSDVQVHALGLLKSISALQGLIEQGGVCRKQRMKFDTLDNLSMKWT
jgi:hypothetical protein